MDNLLRFNSVRTYLVILQFNQYVVGLISDIKLTSDDQMSSVKLITFTWRQQQCVSLTKIFHLSFSRGPSAPPRCRSPAPPSPRPRPPAPASGGLSPETPTGRLRTERRVQPERVRPHRCPTSTRTTSPDSVWLLWTISADPAESYMAAVHEFFPPEDEIFDVTEINAAPLHEGEIKPQPGGGESRGAAGGGSTMGSGSLVKRDRTGTARPPSPASSPTSII